MNTNILSEEIASLNAKIEQVIEKQKAFKEDIRSVEGELEKFSEDRKRFEALRDVCNALDRLKELESEDLFWQGVTDTAKAAEHIETTKGRIFTFEEQIGTILGKKDSIQKEIDQCEGELSILYEEASDAHEREEQRKEAYVIEREASPLPYRKMVMPWAKEVESEKNFRRSVGLALLMCIVFGIIFTLVNVPIPDRTETVVVIPERLVQLVKEESRAIKKPPKRIPQKRPDEATDESKKVAKKEASQEEKKSGGKAATKGKKEVAVAGGGAAKAAARKKASSVGVLAFRDSFKDLMTETRAPNLGTQARLNNTSPRVKGRATPQRSLVAMQAQNGSSGGISGVGGISRNIGNSNVDRLGGIGVGDGEGGSGSGYGIAQVSSNIADLEEIGRPGSDGIAAGRTDEEIQIVFDRYKATLYRIYNKELRKDPTLRGKILMRITIEPDGGVSMCKVESTDLNSTILVNMIVERIKKFNFGTKEGVEKVTILYPIDFLPA